MCIGNTNPFIFSSIFEYSLSIRKPLRARHAKNSNIKMCMAGRRTSGTRGEVDGGSGARLQEQMFLLAPAKYLIFFYDGKHEKVYAAIIYINIKRNLRFAPYVFGSSIFLSGGGPKCAASSAILPRHEYFVVIIFLINNFIPGCPVGRIESAKFELRDGS